MESDIRETISFYYSSYIKDAVAPSRVRGLKQSIIDVPAGDDRRTLTGAWIEAGTSVLGEDRVYRRTLTGAWIEACVSVQQTQWCRVAPSRVRGLKLEDVEIKDEAGESHPHGCVD